MAEYFWIQKNSFNYESEMWERKQYYLPKYNNDYIRERSLRGLLRKII